MAGIPGAQDQQAIGAIRARIASGDLGGARIVCEEFLAHVSDARRQSPVRAWLGVVEQRSGSLSAAVTQYELALQSDRRNVPLMVQLGLAQFQLKNLDRAEHLYRDAIRADPRFALAHYNLGILLQEKRDWAGARRAFESAIMQQPQFPEAMANLANTLVKLSELERAAHFYQQSLAINPQLAVAHHGMALLALRNQQRPLAMQSLQAAVDADPALLSAWLDLAECHHLEGDATRAIACVDSVLARDPGNATAKFERALYAGEQPDAQPTPMLERIYDGMAGHFDEHLTGRLGYRVPWLIIDEVAPWLHSFREQHGHGPAVLDLGCGTGLFGTVVHQHAARLVGVDLSAGMLDKARERGIYDELAESELMTWLDSHPEPADLIAATDVLIYIAKLDGLFDQVARHLRPRGMFTFSIESPHEQHEDFRLGPEARYAHSVAYIERLAGERQLQLRKRIDTVIRSENGKPVDGCVFFLQAT